MTGKIIKLVCRVVLAAAIPLFAQSYDLPLVIVNTQNGQALQKGADKIPATMSILDKGTNSVADSSKGEKYNIGIKIRGQTSADFPKKGLRHRTQGAPLHERRRHGLPRHKPQGFRHAQERRLGVPRTVC